MKRLTVCACLWSNVETVLEEQRPTKVLPGTVFAVFRDNVNTGSFQGLVTAHDITLHPDWIFADLIEYHKLLLITPKADVSEALEIINQNQLEALSVMENHKFVGVVTRQSILEILLQREHVLLNESQRLSNLLDIEHKKIASWAAKLSRLHEASRTLLSVLTYTSIENDLLQTGIDALTNLLEARYGAIGILDESGKLNNFVYSGIGSELALKIGHLPIGKGLLGVVIQENVSLRLDDLGKDPRSVGFPPHHPLIKSLLAVPISHCVRVYGRIYLCEKENGEAFTKADEELAFSFAHSLSLVLENAREMEEIKHARQGLDYLAHFDTLTDLPNRTLLNDRITLALSHAKRNRGKVAILFLDLDNFKLVNDSIGHTLGDILLKKVAGRILHCLRDEDTAARQGGDEFVVMLPDITQARDAANVACKILRALEEPIVIDHHEMFVSTSIGISIYPDNTLKSDELLSNADAAMYYAKKLGKNNYQFFTSEMSSMAQNYMRLEKHLHRALELDELSLYYQPQIAIETGKVIGMEALLRWNNTEFGWIEPCDFIPLAEESGLIIPISEWVLQTACTQAKLWHQNGFMLRIAVNLSSRQFQLHPDNLLNSVLDILGKTDLPPELLELEITETILMQHLDTILEILGQLKNKGVRIVVDDFGTGYSSLSYLKRFPINALKIDKSFISDIDCNADDRAIVSAIIVMAQQLKLEVIAEGIETQGQLDFLRNLHCEFAQGYYFAKPMNSEMSMIFLHEHPDVQSTIKQP